MHVVYIAMVVALVESKIPFVSIFAGDIWCFGRLINLDTTLQRIHIYNIV
jgi:hypothetical protein